MALTSVIGTYGLLAILVLTASCGGHSSNPALGPAVLNPVPPPSPEISAPYESPTTDSPATQGSVISPTLPRKPVPQGERTPQGETTTDQKLPFAPTPAKSQAALDKMVDTIYSPDYAGQLTVKFYDPVKIRTSPDSGFLYSVGGFNNLVQSVNDFLAAYPSAKLSRAVNATPEQVDEAREYLEHLSGQKLINWNSVYRIDVADPDEAAEIVEELIGEEVVEAIEPKVYPQPTGILDTPDLTGHQLYLDEIPGALYAKAAWKKGIKGDGVYVFDSEVGGVNFDHEDLGLKYGDLLREGGNFYIRSECDLRTFRLPHCVEAGIPHGTAVAGIIAGKENGHGVTGIAPDSYFVMDSYGATAVGSATRGLLVQSPRSIGYEVEPGSIWAIEYVNGASHLPVETTLDGFEDIKQATAYGVTVIEGVGNSNFNLDDVSIYTGRLHNLAREDAGAIMVGASDGLNKRKHIVSSYGKRVNVFGWGQGVVTTAYPSSILPYGWHGSTPPVPSNSPSDPNNFYMDNFGGTSAATAMVAGVAALVQSHAKKELGQPRQQHSTRYIMPSKMREILIESGKDDKQEPILEYRDSARPNTVLTKGECTDKDGKITCQVIQCDSTTCPIGVQPRADKAIEVTEKFIKNVLTENPKLTTGEAMSDAEMLDLRQKTGVGLVCGRIFNGDPFTHDLKKRIIVTTTNPDYDPSRPWDFYDPTCPWEYRCIPQDLEASDPDCPEEYFWREGTKIAKDLDFDGDDRADIVQWTNRTPFETLDAMGERVTVEKGTWKLDLSTKGNSTDGFGEWDIIISYPPIRGKWLSPYVADMNSDGREDFVVYDKENGKFFIRLTNSLLLNTPRQEWIQGDWIEVRYPPPSSPPSSGDAGGWRDSRRMDVASSDYSRPVLGDYNRDGWTDIAIACSDGKWRIDHGTGDMKDFGTFDKVIQYLTEEQLLDAPGWAYPTSVHHDYYGYKIAYKVPENLPDEGRLATLNEREPDNDILDTITTHIFGGNDKVFLSGMFAGDDAGEPCDLSLKDTAGGEWKVSCFSQQGEVSRYLPLDPLPPAAIFGNEDCHPAVGDFDGDGLDDRAVMCPEGWKIAYSGDISLFPDVREADTSRKIIPLTYDPKIFSLPGRSYSGGVSYEYTLSLIRLFGNAGASELPIPVDMVTGEGCLPGNC